MNPKISVIVPTYNAEDYLMNAVNSVINQTFGFENIELILVDDNSSDSTKEILNELSSNYENIKAIFLDNNSGSPSKPRNVGIKEAKSDYIMFLDNDDTYCPDFCEKMYETIEYYDADFITCRNYDMVNGKRSKFHSILDKKENFIELKSIEDDDRLLSATSLLIWNKIYKKSLLLDNNIEFPLGTLYEDVYFNIQSYLKAKNIIFLNDYYGYNYNIRLDEDNKSTSQDFKEKNLFKFHDGLKKIFNFMEKENKYFRYFEAEMLIGFTKWLLLTNSNVELKLKFFNDFKKQYKRFKLFTRIEQIPLYKNIPINLGIKFISLSNFCFIIVNKIINLII